MFDKETVQLLLPLGGRPSDFDFEQALNDPNWRATRDDYKLPVLIPKRSGGFREILEPQDYLKRAQERIVQILYGMGFGASPYAHGFVLGRSRRTNATPHIGHKYMLKCDLENFFGNCTPEIVLNAIRELQVPDWLPKVIEKLCFLDGGLPQGAPTSPILSNIAARPMDYRIDGLRQTWRRKPARRRRRSRRGTPASDIRLEAISYSRYADDLTFSSNYEKLNQLVYPLESLLKACGFTLKKSKTKFFSMPSRLETCGVVVSKTKINAKRQTRRYWRGRLHQMVWDIRNGRVPAGHYRRKDGGVAKLTRKNLFTIQGNIASIVDISPQDRESLFGLYKELTACTR